MLTTELLGKDPSVVALSAQVAERAAGNPFFAEEIVRELVEGDVLEGQPGATPRRRSRGRQCAGHRAGDHRRAHRPPRPDRETHVERRSGGRLPVRRRPAHRAGRGSRRWELVEAELLDQVRVPGAEYVFHHPLIRTVAYESQLRSDRAQLHHRVAAAIESHDPSATEENAALIAAHLEAAGDLHTAYGWHMRAATWPTNRDIGAARANWERAREIADALPADDPDRTAMRIAPRTMLCGIAWRVHEHVAGARFEELRQLCTAAGDKASLAIAMAGLVIDHVYQDRVREASQLASEAMALIESIGDPTLTVGLSTAAIYAKIECAESCDVLQWSQRVIDLADGDPSKGNFLFGSPLALAFGMRGIAPVLPGSSRMA